MLVCFWELANTLMLAAQARMDHFLAFSQRFAKIKSKRLQVRSCQIVELAVLDASPSTMKLLLDLPHLHNNDARTCL